MKVHTLVLQKDGNKAFLNGEELDPSVSQKFRNHSPDGFNWGYSGSGPAQLALAVMVHIYGKPMKYQSFKERVISRCPQRVNCEVTFTILKSELDE